MLLAQDHAFVKVTCTAVSDLEVEYSEEPGHLQVSEAVRQQGHFDLEVCNETPGGGVQ